MKYSLIVAAAATLLAACSQQTPSNTAPTAATPPASPAQPQPAAEAIATPNYPSDYRIDQPIPAGDIKTQLTLVGRPSYNQKKDLLTFDVEISNLGKSPLVSSGEYPVWMAIESTDGIDKSPARHVVGSARLPLIVENTKGLVHAKIPAAHILGQTVRVELFQHRVGWFRAYRQPAIDVGIFVRCNGQAATLCDAAGAPLAIN